MPFTMPLIFSTLINNMAWAIGLEITLAFLGLVNMTIPTLGTMLYWAINYQAILLGRWWWILTPVVLAIVAVLSPCTGFRSASANTSIPARASSAWGQDETAMKNSILRTENLKAFYVLDMSGTQKIVKAVNEVDLEIYENEVYRDCR